MSTTTDTVKTALKVGLSLATKSVIAAAITALPFLGLPVLNQLFTWGVEWVAAKLLPHLQVFFVDTIIDIEVNAEKKAYARAREELQKVLTEKITNPAEVENASEEFDNRLADLIRFRP
jgi:hypothetical protein